MAKPKKTVYKCSDEERKFFRIHNSQFGGSTSLGGDLLYYRGSPYRQRGNGLGGFFGSLFRRLIPFAKQYVLPHAKTALKNVAVDVLEGGRPLRESLKDHGIGALKSVGRQIVGQSGSGCQVRRRVSRKKKQKGKEMAKRVGRKKRTKKMKGRGLLKLKPIKIRRKKGKRRPLSRRDIFSVV
jgi:hypothetical protein